jgi:hypothetical protein
MTVFDGVFIPRERSDGSGWDFEAVPEGARPAPHIPEQAEGRWADFTKKIRSRKANSVAAAAAEVLRWQN